MDKDTGIQIEIANRVFQLKIANNTLTTRDGDYHGHYEILARVSNPNGSDDYYPIKVVN